MYMFQNKAENWKSQASGHATELCGQSISRWNNFLSLCFSYFLQAVFHVAPQLTEHLE